MNVLLLNLHLPPMRWVILNCAQVYRWGSGGMERQCDLLMAAADNEVQSGFNHPHSTFTQGLTMLGPLCQDPQESGQHQL